jgi:hypothetical protein
LEGFAFRQAAVLDVGLDFRVHMERLTKSMDRILSLKKLPESEAVSSELISFEEKKSSNAQSSSHLDDDLPRVTNLTNAPLAADHSHGSNATDEQPVPVQEDSKRELQTRVASLEGRPAGIDQAEQTEASVETKSDSKVFIGFFAFVLIVLIVAYNFLNSGSR